MAVSAAGWPVTTPRELVWVRRDVWGKASTEEVTAAEAEPVADCGVVSRGIGYEMKSVDVQSSGQQWQQ